jgi:hypothetical protein
MKFLSRIIYYFYNSIYDCVSLTNIDSYGMNKRYYLRKYLNKINDIIYDVLSAKF